MNMIETWGALGDLTSLLAHDRRVGHTRHGDPSGDRSPGFILPANRSPAFHLYLRLLDFNRVHLGIVEG